MKGSRRNIIILIIALFSLFAVINTGWSLTVERPHALFNGWMQTFADNGGSSDDLVFLYTTVKSVVYSDGSVVTDPALDSIIGGTVAIAGAKRLDVPGTNFTDATITISKDGFPYFSASLSNIDFISDGVQWYLNPGLDVNNPDTMNLSDFTLQQDTTHPSNYILDLTAVLGSNDIAGMKMIIDVLPGYDITGNSYSTISGLIDGVQATVNTPPVADAGENIFVSTELVSSTVIQGTAEDTDGDTLHYRWLWVEGQEVLLDWTSVVNGKCPLDLSTLAVGIGTYNLTLEVDDGKAGSVSANNMQLIIDNSAPHAVASGGGTYEINSNVILKGEVFDFDNDPLTYRWMEGTGVICEGNLAESNVNDDSVAMPDCPASGLGLGTHMLTLQVDDGLNLPDSKTVEVVIVDTAVPNLAPVPDKLILWPPNHEMVDVLVEANASDNSGIPPALTVAVSSNEPQDGLGDDDIGPDSSVVSIDESTGVILLQLRRERSGSGEGRTYTVIITATDDAANTTVASTEIEVPHDKRKK